MFCLSSSKAAEQMKPGSLVILHLLHHEGGDKGRLRDSILAFRIPGVHWECSELRGGGWGLRGGAAPAAPAAAPLRPAAAQLQDQAWPCATRPPGSRPMRTEEGYHPGPPTSMRSGSASWRQGDAGHRPCHALGTRRQGAHLPKPSTSCLRCWHVRSSSAMLVRSTAAHSVSAPRVARYARSSCTITQPPALRRAQWQARSAGLPIHCLGAV